MLCERTACERFVTLFWGVFDVETSTLRYVNAGHVAPILIRRDENRMEQLVEGGPVLGLLPNVSYSAVTVQIAESDSLVLYSDGISEATDHNEKEFGEDRIQEIVARCREAAAGEICEQIMDRVTAFASAEAPADDCTLMVVRFLSPGACCVSKDMVEQVVA